MNNIKGKNELFALKELGFVLDYNRYSIEAGIRKYQKGQLTAVDVGTYGLEERVMHGRKLLYLSRAAVQRLFGAHVSSYADPNLWQKMGPIYIKAETVPLSKLKNAIDFFKTSLAMRKTPAKQHQLRVDPADGKAYPLDSFLECYGQVEGQRRWATAAQQPGDRGHDFMRANIEACVTALEECYERRDLADTSARLGGLSLTGASK
jgi:hypothetical protein